MGVSNSQEIFQDKINNLFQWFGFIREYMYKLLVLKKVDVKVYLEKLELVLIKIK